MWLENDVAPFLGFFILPVFELGGVDDFVEVDGSGYLFVVTLQAKIKD